MRMIVSLLLLCGVAEAKGTSDCQQPSAYDPFDARPMCTDRKAPKSTTKKPAAKPVKPAPAPAPAPAKQTCQPRNQVDPFDARPVCSDAPKKPVRKTKTT